MRRVLAGLAAMAIVAAAAPAIAAEYRADLGPMPLDDETKAFIAGRGDVSASLLGDRLEVKGSFRGLPSRATAAHLLLSAAIGVPGRTILPLQVSGQTEGTLSGSYRLSQAQVQALRTGRLYVELDSEKAPPGYSWGPKGTLWGWLLPAHPMAADGVPQQGPWFVPQLDTPSR